MMAVHWWRVIGSGRSAAFKEISPSTLDTRRFLQQPTKLVAKLEKAYEIAHTEIWSKTQNRVSNLKKQFVKIALLETIFILQCS